MKENLKGITSWLILIVCSLLVAQCAEGLKWGGESITIEKNTVIKKEKCEDDSTQVKLTLKNELGVFLFDMNKDYYNKKKVGDVISYKTTHYDLYSATSDEKTKELIATKYNAPLSFTIIDAILGVISFGSALCLIAWLILSMCLMVVEECKFYVIRFPYLLFTSITLNTIYLIIFT